MHNTIEKIENICQQTATFCIAFMQNRRQIDNEDNEG